MGRCTEEVTRRGGICVYITIDTVSHTDTVILYHTDTVILYHTDTIHTDT